MTRTLKPERWQLTQQIEAEGMLMRDGNSIMLSLSGGGAWQIECDPTDLKHLGMRVRVIDDRIGFNAISAETVTLI